MSYLVLARKWRPKGFEDLIGQEPISRILGNAIEQGRIAHAYLFSGPRGVGKTTTARVLAKALNCEQGPTRNPCGVCESCKGITYGSSIDVMEIDGASNNSVDDIRDLRENVRYAPVGGKYKVYIIDEVHMLSASAFNALLKTLEEPPAHVIFVLATTASGKVPATVLSRCQHLPFRRIPIHMIRERLRMISDSEGINISDAALEIIARASDGSMRDSLTILDQVSAFSSDIEESEVKDLLGIADFRALSELALSVIKGDRKRIVYLINELTDRGTDLKSFTKDLMNFFRDLLVARVVGKSGEVLDYSENEISVIKDISGTVSEDQLTLLLGEMIKAEYDVRVSFAPRIGLEMSLIRASFFNALKPINEAIERLESFAEGIGYTGEVQGLPVTRGPEKEFARDISDKKIAGHSEVTQMTANEEPATVAEELSNPVFEAASADGAAARLYEGKALWNALIQRVEAVNHLLSCKLSEASAELKGDTLVVTFNGGSAIHADSVKNEKQMLEGIVSEMLNKKIFVKVETVKKKIVRRKDLHEKMLSEPIIKEAIELFEGRLVDVRQTDNSDNGGENV